MSVIYAVVWAEAGKTQKLIPVDEDLYGDTPEKAKELARGLLPKANRTQLFPTEVLQLTQEKLDGMVSGVTPLLTFNADTEQEFEMLELAP